jgi:hypothetical protein
MRVAVDAWVTVTPFCIVVAVMVMVEVPLGVPGTVRFELPPQATGPQVKLSSKRGKTAQRCLLRFRP